MKATYKALLSSALMLTSVASMAADRLLARGPGYEVTHNYAETCGPAAAITIHSQDHEFFTSDPSQLQHILDATSAMLEFQCGHIEVIGVTGELTGLRGPMYAGTARRSDDWMLVAERSIRETRDSEYGSERLPSSPPEDAPGYTVANLSTGMSVQVAEKIMQETFGAAPRYDAAHGLMTLNLNGCPDDYDGGGSNPGSGWKCLKAWFSDQRVPTLERLRLVQVIEDIDMAVVESALEKHFGPPDARRVPSGDGWWAGGMKSMQMLWGGASGVDTTTPQLEASLSRRGEMIVAVINLDVPGLKKDWVAQESVSTGLVL